MRYKHVACPDVTFFEFFDDRLPPVLMSILMGTILLFGAYEAFVDRSDQAQGTEILGLMSVVWMLEVLQVLAIKKLENNPFLGVLVAKNVVGQLAELVIYDDIKQGALYDSYPIMTNVWTSIGMGALKVCGQVTGKSLFEDPDPKLRSSLSVLVGGVGVALGLCVTEVIRENQTSLEPSSLWLGVLLPSLLMVSAAQSVGVKKMNDAQYAYFATVRQMASVGISFALNNQLESGDQFFVSSDANLAYRSAVIASVKILGYLAGREYVFAEKASLVLDPTELSPLLESEEKA